MATSVVKHLPEKQRGNESEEGQRVVKSICIGSFKSMIWDKRQSSIGQLDNKTVGNKAVKHCEAIGPVSKGPMMQ